MFKKWIIIIIWLWYFFISCFKGYKESTKPIFIVSMLYIPFTMPFNLLYYRLFSSEMWDLFFGSGFKYASIVCILGAFAVGALGALLGIKISKELSKAGVLKKWPTSSGIKKLYILFSASHHHSAFWLQVLSLQKVFTVQFFWF